jgi:hypothetical protein
MTRRLGQLSAPCARPGPRDYFADGKEPRIGQLLLLTSFRMGMVGEGQCLHLPHLLMARRGFEQPH